MHRLIRQQCSADAKSLALARFHFDDGGIVLAFRPGVAAPAWIAKRSVTDVGRERLRNERIALQWLAPWQETLRIPRVLAWSEGIEDACMILSGVPGFKCHPVMRQGGSLEGPFLAVQTWLRRFHELAPGSEAVGIPELHEKWMEELQSLPGQERRCAGLWAQWKRMRAPARPATPIHNDFWWGNLLFAGERMGVIDWNGFCLGTPLDDLLTLFFKTPVRQRWRLLGAGAAFRWTFFDRSPARRILQMWVEEYGLGAEEAGYCFYSFLVRRLHWELGFSMQPRSTQEKDLALRTWSSILGWLAAQRYPNPFAAW